MTNVTLMPFNRQSLAGVNAVVVGNGSFPDFWKLSLQCRQGHEVTSEIDIGMGSGNSVRPVFSPDDAHAFIHEIFLVAEEQPVEGVFPQQAVVQGQARLKSIKGPAFSSFELQVNCK
jgi:hypothetical protein